MAKAKILVVEDEAITAEDIHYKLKDLGYDVPAIAASGESAIKKAEEIKPDLVLMDIVLNGDMDGIEAAEQICDRFDIPVVYLSAYIDEARLEKTKVTEPYGYIIKPVENKELRPAIEMALQRHKLEKALRTAERDWRTSFNSLDDVMLIIDRDYTIEKINEIGLKLLRKSKEEIIGQKCYQVISGADSLSEDCPCRKSRESKKVESIDRYEDRFGKSYSIKSSPIFDENGEIIKFVDLLSDITERKQAEERIEHLNSVLKAILKVNQLITMEKDRDRLLQSACDNLIETRGYYNAWIALIDESGSLVTTAEARLGKDFLPLVERLKRSEWTDCGRKALMQLQVVATEDPFSTCTDCPLSDKYHDRGALTVRLEYGGKVYGLLSVSLPKELTADEEEQNLFKEVAGDLAFALYSIGLEEERKRAEEKYRLLVESAQDHIFIIDSDMRIQYSNQFAAGLLGCRPEEIIGKHLEEVFPPDLSNSLKHNLKTVFESGELLHVEDRFTLPDKESWLDTRLIPLKAGNGEITSILGISRDITERKQMEEALRENEERFQALTESTSDWIWEVDESAVYTYASPKIKELLGYEPEEVIGKTPFDLMTPEDVKRVAAEFTAIAEVQKPFDRLENQNLHKNGQILVLETSGVPIFDANGNFRGYRGIDRDITERKKAEDAIMKKSEALKRFNKLAVGRELRMVELKKEINALREQLGKEPRYNIEGKV